MDKKQISIEEYVELISDDSNGDHEIISDSLKEDYEKFLMLLDQTEQATEFSLPLHAKQTVFAQVWNPNQTNVKKQSMWKSIFQPLFLKPAAAFAWGITAGCMLTVLFLNGFLDLAKPVSAEEALTIHKTIGRQTYQGTFINELYSQLENPVLVIETQPGNADKPKKVLYGTADNGEIYIAWNL